MVNYISCSIDQRVLVCFKDTIFVINCAQALCIIHRLRAHVNCENKVLYISLMKRKISFLQQSFLNQTLLHVYQYLNVYKAQ